jgi:hypothetical protein
MSHISKQILKTLSGTNVYVNVTYLKVNIENLEMNVYVNVTYLKANNENLEWDECLCKCYNLKVNIENLEWDECLCKCYISQSKY